MTEIIITEHGAQRLKDRLGLSKKLAEKNARKALEWGVTHAEAKGRLRKYFDKLYLSCGIANNVRVYCRHVYIFHGNVLITIMDLPRNLHRLADQIQEQKGGK